MKKNNTEVIKLKQLMRLAGDFGLPCIVREKEVTIVGTEKLIIFKRQEKLCHMKSK